MPIPRGSFKLLLRTYSVSSTPIPSVSLSKRKEAVVIPGLARDQLYTYGSGLHSKTGHGDYTFLKTPTLLKLPFPVTKVAHGIAHSIALLTNGAVFCWGSNFYGQCGIPPLLSLGYIADGSFFEENDELSTPQKMYLQFLIPETFPSTKS
jgi:alpha-tubulin suppressor-like RCC1 family protein